MAAALHMLSSEEPVAIEIASTSEEEPYQSPSGFRRALAPVGFLTMVVGMVTLIALSTSHGHAQMPNAPGQMPVVDLHATAPSVPTMDVNIPLTLTGASLFSARTFKMCSYDTPWVPTATTWRSPWLDYIALHNQIRDGYEKQVAEPGKALIWHCLDHESCGGTGDEIRGISAALYLAMMTKRALFIRWSRHGQDITELLPPKSINFHVPPSFNAQCTEVASMDDCLVMDRADADTICKFQELVWREETCLSVQTNAVPKVFWDAAEAEASENPSMLTDMVLGAIDGFRAHINQQNIVGCAANFLFDWKHAFESLPENSQVLVPALGNTQTIPDKYVAVHMRIGDRVFEGNDLDLSGDANLAMGDAIYKPLIDRAIQCAVFMGEALWSKRFAWGRPVQFGIFFASDSAAARSYAMSRSTNHVVFTTDRVPLHMDHQSMQVQGQRAIWQSWADELLLQRAQAMVLCDSGSPQCFLSGFSQLAAEVAFMPPHLLWILNDTACAPTVTVDANANM